MKINFGKSKLVLVGDALNVEALAGIFRCKVAKLPMTYLGLSLFTTLWQKNFGLECWRKWSGDWLGGKDYIFLRGQYNFNKEHIFQPAYLLIISVSYLGEYC